MPNIKLEELVHAVSLHDYPFGTMDNKIIGQMKEDDYQQLHIDAIYNLRMNNKLTETLVRMHSHNMILDHNIGNKRRIEHSKTIQDTINKYNFDKSLIDYIYQIVGLLDSMSFDFCFYYGTDQTNIRTKVLKQGDKETVITVSVLGNTITLSERPFNKPEINTYIHAYDNITYPNGEPFVIPVKVKKA